MVAFHKLEQVGLCERAAISGGNERKVKLKEERQKVEVGD